ncbi:hypothetical protein A3D05_06170 [Candidatus Gottesmanbacteria bacterium RIFCSPHIGHO2_02_FULL_40_24]|nr:MAG: hypothetical protein A3D05_06170 [Candidatus Gottesmanbacteria bacterium RIFCSPHIGHO2_02_FULL_40_24]
MNQHLQINKKFIPLFILIILIFIFTVQKHTSSGLLAAAAYPYSCTQVIGYDQVGEASGGWYVTGGVFEAVVEDSLWQLLWNGGGGVDRWQFPGYTGWNNGIISSCGNNSQMPDRVILSISGPYGSDESTWVLAVKNTISTISQKIPSAKVIILQSVVGGPGHQTCPCHNNCQYGNTILASWQNKHIDNAISRLLQDIKDEKYNPGVEIKAGISPEVRSCADYRDGTGHLTVDGAKSVGGSIGLYYLMEDLNNVTPPPVSPTPTPFPSVTSAPSVTLIPDLTLFPTATLFPTKTPIPTPVASLTFFPSKTPTPSGRIPGDADNNGKVDGLDYVLWLNNYNFTTEMGPEKGDFNGDYKVNGLDYVVWLNNYKT